MPAQINSLLHRLSEKVKWQILKKHTLSYPMIFWGITVCLLTPFAFKMLWVSYFVHRFTGHWLLGAAQVLLHDTIILAVLGSLLYISFLPKITRWLTIGLRMIACAAFIIYLIDFIVIVNFNTHLIVDDAFKYGGYSSTYIGQLFNGKSAVVLGLSLICLVGISFFLFSRQVIRAPKHHYKVSGFFACGVVAFLSCSDETYVHSWIYKNVVEYNLSVRSETKDYSSKTVASPDFSDLVCINTPIQQTQKKRNVIILMVESLSSYQSQLFSGINHWTPMLDQLAKNNSYYPNFYANGFTTEDGEISLLTGLAPLYPPSIRSNDGGNSFKGFFAIPHALPHIFNAQGYQSRFITTADLSFANTGNWAKSVGFTQVIGADDAFYKGHTRYNFNAPSDEVLYQKVQSLILQEQQPYFYFVKTVSTHHPYINPENGQHSVNETFSYSDKQIGKFYNTLEKNNFFDNGILFIVGDHHAMLPLMPQELSQFGAFRASARIPLIVVDGQTHEHPVTANFQQTDIYNTLKNEVQNTLCTSLWSGQLMGAHTKAPDYILHHRGDQREMISVFTPSTDYLVKLDGDDTRIVTPKAVSEQTKNTIVKHINSARINRE